MERLFFCLSSIINTGDKMRVDIRRERNKMAWRFFFMKREKFHTMVYQAAAVPSSLCCINLCLSCIFLLDSFTVLDIRTKMDPRKIPIIAPTINALGLDTDDAWVEYRGSSIIWRMGAVVNRVTFASSTLFTAAEYC